MFIVSKMKDTIKVEPQDLALDRGMVLKRVIGKRYNNKIVPKLGLCVCVFDLLDASEGMVLHGDGCLYHKVLFRLVIFRPSMSETILGKVQKSDAIGLQVSVGFFDDIFVPSRNMFPTSAFDPKLKQWFYVSDFDTDREEWKGLDADALHKAKQKALLQTPSDERLYIVLDEQVRIRVVEEVFQDTGPTKPPKITPVMPQPPSLGTATAITTPETDSSLAPYTIIAACDEDGLGVVDWWRETEG